MKKWVFLLVFAGGAQAQNATLDGLRQAAGQGNVTAQYQLAMQYDLLGFPANSQYWLHKAAQNGSATAQYNLYQRYRTGKIVLQDPQKALKWLKKAACSGLVNAQTQLGLQLEKSDPEQAYRWFLQASKQGYPAALEGLERLKGQETASSAPLCP